MVKDFYDLDYDIPSPLPKIKEKFMIKSPPKRQNGSSNDKSSALAQRKIEIGNYSMILSDRKKHSSKTKKTAIFSDYTHNP